MIGLSLFIIDCSTSPSSSSSSSSTVANGTITVTVTGATAANGKTAYFGVYPVYVLPNTGSGYIASGSFTISSGTGSGVADVSNSSSPYTFTGGVMYNVGVLIDMNDDFSTVQGPDSGDKIGQSFSNQVDGNINITLNYSTFGTY